MPRHRADSQHQGRLNPTLTCIPPNFTPYKCTEQCPQCEEAARCLHGIQNWNPSTACVVYLLHFLFFLLHWFMLLQSNMSSNTGSIGPHPHFLYNSNKHFYFPFVFHSNCWAWLCYLQYSHLISSTTRLWLYLCRVRNKDIRKFLDGIYVSNMYSVMHRVLQFDRGTATSHHGDVTCEIATGSLPCTEQGHP